MIQRLVQRGFVEMVVEGSQEIGQEKYSLSPLYEKMMDCFLKTLKQERVCRNPKSGGEPLYDFLNRSSAALYLPLNVRHWQCGWRMTINLKSLSRL
ncbi:hypothetical protein RCO48_32380 [Peribacillus frigoritolerans]|nr:hypothetical protein [Peribacillus frigoritolerans]